MNTQLFLQLGSKRHALGPSVIKVGEAVKGQGGGDVILGTKLGSDGV